MRARIRHLAIILLTAISLLPTSEAADTSSRLDCAAGLTPDRTSLKYSRDLRLVYLRTLTEEQWKEAKKEYGVSFPELFSGTYNDYVTTRSQVFEKIEYRFDDKVALSLFIQRLSDTSRAKFFECVIALAKLRAGGVAVYFLNETGKTRRIGGHLRRATSMRSLEDHRRRP